jgi:hypothetical protein
MTTPINLRVQPIADTSTFFADPTMAAKPDMIHGIQVPTGTGTGKLFRLLADPSQNLYTLVELSESTGMQRSNIRKAFNSPPFRDLFKLIGWCSGYRQMQTAPYAAEAIVYLCAKGNQYDNPTN